MNHTSPAREAIAERAYYLWEQADRPEGRDKEFWLRAEAELSAASAMPPVLPPPISPQPQATDASPALAIPPAIKSAVKSPGPRPPRPRLPKRA